MSCRCVLLQEAEKERFNSKVSSSPILPNSNSRPLNCVGNSTTKRALLTTDPAGDPIWDSIRAEAKYEEFFECMCRKFEMSMMGELNLFLGLQIKQLKDNIFINQSKYIKDLLKQFDMESYKPAKTPMSTSVKMDADEKGAEKEPILSSFLYASVLSHDCLEQALGFVLSNRLQKPTLLATQLMDIFVNVMMDDRGIQRSIRLDVQAFRDRDPACASYSWALLYLKGYHSLQSYRVAHVLWNQGRKVLALALQSRISEVFSVDIHPAAKIGEGILLDHGTGLVIGETAIVGNKVSLMQGVTLGGTGKEIGDRHPKIGQGALIGAGATILGNITIGEGAMIAAGSLVLKSVPPHSMAAGNPATVVGRVEDEDPSLTMKHDATKDYFEQVAVSSTEERINGMHGSNKVSIE